MIRRAAVLAAPFVMLVGLAMPLGGGSAQAAPVGPHIYPSEWCGNQAPPCVVAASRNGTAITESDPTYAVSASGSLQSGEFLTQWSIADALIKGTYATLASTDAGVPFSITVDVGAHPPRVLDEYAGGVSVTKTYDSGSSSWDVTVSGTAVEQGVNADCNAINWTCPYNETSTIVAFQGEIGDWQQWPDSAQWNDFNGLDQWTNVELTEIPPEITGTPFTITEQLGNSHELNGQLFQGFWNAVLPNAVLVDMGINDPSTLTSAGISASAGTGSVTVTPGSDVDRDRDHGHHVLAAEGAYQARLDHTRRADWPDDPPGCRGRWLTSRSTRRGPGVPMSVPTRAAVWLRTTSPGTASAPAHQ